MALRLTVISDQSAELASAASIVFGVGGGNIGRARDNDWVLPDPKRYLSSHHARVQFRRGTYYLEDTSTNGVYVNDSTTALARRGPHALADGDVLRLGSYRVLVKLDASDEPRHNDPQLVEASSVFAVGEVLPQLEKIGRELSTSGDLAADLDVSDLFAPLDAAASARLHRPARVPPPSADEVQPAVQAAAEALSVPPAGALTSDDALLGFDQAQARRAEPSQPPRSMPRNLQAAQGAATRVSSGAAAFCRGAGIDPQRFPEESHAKLLYLGGLLLREALVGIKGLALAQHDIQAALRISSVPSESRPTLRDAPIDELLVQLLAGHERRELDAIMWLREKLATVRRHDAAMAHAMHVALAEFVARLDPRELSIGVDLHRANGTSNIDDTLAHRFRSITENSSGGLPHLFTEAFTQAFGEELRRTGSAPGTLRGGQQK